MTSVIDKEGTELLEELERQIKSDSLKIEAYARRRDRLFGAPNFMHNFLRPLAQQIWLRLRRESPKPTKQSKK